MRISIIGAGAIGTWLACLLVDGGHDVTLIARGATHAAIAKTGVTLLSGEMSRQVPVAVAAVGEPMPPQDYVILALKGHDVPDAITQSVSLIAQTTKVVSALNGIPWWFFHGMPGPLEGAVIEAVDPGGLVAAAIPVERVEALVVHATVRTERPGIVRLVRDDKLIVGSPSKRRSLSLADSFEGVAVEYSDDIRYAVWTKLLGNMVMNPLSALTGATTGALLADPEVRALGVGMMHEMGAVGLRLGMPPTMTPDDRMAMTQRLGDFRTSMLEDLHARKRLEIGPIIGALVEIADRLDVAVPLIRAVLGLVRTRAGSVA